MEAYSKLNRRREGESSIQFRAYNSSSFWCRVLIDTDSADPMNPNESYGDNG